MKTKAKKQPPAPADRDHVAMIQNPNRWPAWPFLPVKKRDHRLLDESFGVIVDDGKGVIIYQTSLFRLPQRMEDWASLDKKVYASAEEAVADDWIVD